MSTTADQTFGPFLAQHFDFTSLFEDSILAILPSTLFLCASTTRAWKLWNRPRKVSRSHLFPWKTIALVVFAILQITCLALSAAPDVHQSKAFVAAAVLAVADGLAICVLSPLEHFRSVRPSFTINLYLFLTLPMDAARIRTIWMRGDSLPLTIVSTVLVTSKGLLLVVEAIEKRHILLPVYGDYPPESTSSVYSQSMFWWLRPLMLDGSKNVLTNEGLDALDVDMQQNEVQQRLKNVWSHEKHKLKRNAFLRSLLWTLRVPLAKAVFPRLCASFFQYMQPFLLTATVQFLSDSASSSSRRTGWALTAAYGLDFVGYAIANAAYMHQTYRMVTLARAALLSSIYHRTIDLNVASVDESAAVTIMSTDVERICSGLQYFHGLWASPLDATIGFYLLYRRLGLAAIGPILLSILCGSIIMVIAVRYAATAQRLWVGHIQTRIDATSKMLGGMKSVKLLGLSTVMQGLISRLREEEIRTSLHFRRISLLRLIFGKGSEVLAAGVTFAAYAVVCRSTGKTLDVASAYSALNIVTLMTVALGETIQNCPTILSAVGCLERVQDFLNLQTQESQPSGRIMASLPSSDDLELARLPAIELAIAIGVERASFGWLALTPIINDVTFKIAKHSLTFIVGPVGCGKSTLLKGLLGETPFTTGIVRSQTRNLGFVDQTSWIQQGTVQSNIMGILAHDEGWYHAVLHACCLQDDIARLPQGDLTRVGSARITLSGGQRQRIALARAVYSKQKLLVLDDCFSGLDATSEDKIFNRLLGKHGLVRQHDMTVILSTHAVHRLDSADNIIVLNLQGRIAEQGTFSHLLEHGTFVPTMTARCTAENSKPHELTEPVLPRNSVKGISQEYTTARTGSDSDRMSGDWRTYKAYFEACGWINTFCFLGGLTVFAVFVRMPDVWIAFWTAAIEKRGNAANGFYIAIYLLFETLALVALALTGYLVFLVMTPSASQGLHSRILDTAVAAPLSFFATTDIGDTLNRFSQDMNLVDIDLPPSYLEMCAQVLLCTIQAIFISLSVSYFAASLPFVLFVMYHIQKFYLRTSRQLRLLDLEAKAPLYSHFVETLEGLITIRAFGWVEHFEATNARLTETSQKPFYLLYAIQRWLGLVLDLTVAGLVVLLMILFTSLRGDISPALAAVALVSINGFNVSLTQLIKAWTTLETAMGAVSRCQSFSTKTLPENLPCENIVLPPEVIWPSQGDVKITNLSASYDAQTPVLKNLTLHIRSGQKIGLCGSSGSGKSSLVAVLFRLLEISSGSITIDDVDISRLSRQHLRLRLNAVPQDSFFSKGTIRQNLDPFAHSNDEVHQLTLQKVTLWPIVARRGGLDAPMDADMFSAGQRQLFCLARAMLHPSKVVVLDEVTSSVDVATDALMQRLIRQEFGERTIIAVAHRLDTIMDFDKVAMLRGGELVEFDEPGVLMARESAFRTLCESH